MVFLVHPRPGILTAYASIVLDSCYYRLIQLRLTANDLSGQQKSSEENTIFASIAKKRLRISSEEEVIITS